MTNPEPSDAENWLPDEDALYCYSEADFADILGDAFVDIREQATDDATAAAICDIVYERLTDGFYTHE
jgi:hypothetical protein